MTTDTRKIIAGSIIAVLALSILSVVTSAYSENPTDNEAKEKKHADEKAKHKAKEKAGEVKDKAKEKAGEVKDKAKEKIKEEKAKAKENTGEQDQQATSGVNGTTTTGVNNTTKRPEAAEKLRSGSTFSLTGTGEASNKDGNDTAQVSANFELSVFRATPHMVLLKLTSGTITIGDTTHTVEKGKTAIAMKAHKLILTAHVSGDDGAKLLKLFGSAENPTADSPDDASVNTHAIQLKGNLAQWFIKMDAEVTKLG